VIWEEVAEAVRALVSSDAPEVLLFQVRTETPLVLDQVDGDERLEEGDDDFTIPESLRGLLEQDAGVYVLSAGDEFIVVAVDAEGAVGGGAGEDGASAYEIWLEEGNVGSVDDFLASLIGPAGAPGDDGAPGPAGPVAPAWPVMNFQVSGEIPDGWTALPARVAVKPGTTCELIELAVWLGSGTSVDVQLRVNGAPVGAPITALPGVWVDDPLDVDIAHHDYIDYVASNPVDAPTDLVVAPVLSYS
jgi:hypothetical protein